MEPSDAGDGERDDDDGFSILLLPAKAVEVLLRGLLHIAGGAFRALAGVASQAGHIGLILGVIAGTAILMVAAIRIDSLSMGLTSLAVPVAGAIAQFAAWKFITLCERMVRNSPTRTSSLVLFHFIGLLLMLGAVASIIVGSYLMVKYAEQAIALVSVGIAIVLTVQGLLYLDRPSTLNVVVDPSCTAGEDGLALIGTFLKASLVGARLIFGAVCLSGGVTAAIGATMFIVKDDQGWLALAVLGSWVVGYGALFPLTTYVVSVLYYIVPDVLLAVMRRGRSAR